MFALSFIMLSMLFVGVNAYSARYDHWYQSDIMGATVYGDWTSNIIQPQSGGTVGYVVFANNYPVAEDILAGHFALDVNVLLGEDMFLGGFNTAYAKIRIGMTDTSFQCHMIIKITSNNPSDNVEIVFSFDGIDPSPIVPIMHHPARQDYPPYHDYKFVFKYESIRSPIARFADWYDVASEYRIEVHDAVTGDLDEVLLASYCGFESQHLLKPTYYYREWIDMGNWMYYGHFHVSTYMFDNKLGCHSDVRNSDAVCNMIDVSFIASKYGRTAGLMVDWWWNTNDWAADVNADFKIDMKDVSYIANHFGLPP